jgi:integrase
MARRTEGKNEVTEAMSIESYGAKSRQPVYAGDRRIPDLWMRRLRDGTFVFEFMGRLGGKVRRKTLKSRTKTDAVAELRALQVDFDRGEVSSATIRAITVGELAADWFVDLRQRVGHPNSRHCRAQGTVDLYGCLFRNHIEPEIGHIAVAEVTVIHVRRLLAQLVAAHHSGSHTKNILGVLSRLIRYGVKLGVVTRNPVEDLDRDERPDGRRASEPRYLSLAEVERLAQELSDTYRPIALVCALAGLRISEALALSWKDISFEAATISVRAQLGPGRELIPTKTRASAASVPLFPALAAELHRHRDRIAASNPHLVDPDAFLFMGRGGKPRCRSIAGRAIRQAGFRAGLNTEGRPAVHAHDLRHSYVANVLAFHATVPEAAILARHSNAQITASIYGGVTDEARSQIATKLVAAGFGVEPTYDSSSGAVGTTASAAQATSNANADDEASHRKRFPGASSATRRPGSRITSERRLGKRAERRLAEIETELGLETASAIAAGAREIAVAKDDRMVRLEFIYEAQGIPMPPGARARYEKKTWEESLPQRA